MGEEVGGLGAGSRETIVGARFRGIGTGSRKEGPSSRDLGRVKF